MATLSNFDNIVVHATPEIITGGIEFNIHDEDASIPTIELCSSSRQNSVTSTSSNGIDFFCAETLTIDEQLAHEELSTVSAKMVSVEQCPSPITIPAESSIGQDRNRAEYISATIHKEDKETPIGIGLKSIDECLTIRSIAVDGLLSDSPFQVGDILISIDNTGCKGMDEITASHFLRSLVGTITFVVQNVGGNPNLVESMITKKHPNDVAGIGLKGGSTSDENDKPAISRISSDGLFASSLLNVSDSVLAVNNVSCEYLTSQETADLIKNAPNKVNIVAKSRPETAAVLATSQVPRKRPKFISTTIHKPTSQTPMGITLRAIHKSFKKEIVIASIKDGLIKEATPFRAFDILVSINNRKLSNLSPKVASHLLESLSGNITLCVINPYGDETVVEAAAPKLCQKQKMGIVLKSIHGKEEKGGIVVSSITSDSFFKYSLQPGDAILSINDIGCDHLDVKTAASIIQHARKSVRIVAKKALPQHPVGTTTPTSVRKTSRTNE